MVNFLLLRQDANSNIGAINVNVAAKKLAERVYLESIKVNKTKKSAVLIDIPNELLQFNMEITK